jgi:hypothetical protein
MLVLMSALICHYVGDFLLQSREMGQKKSTDFGVLLDHLSILFRTFCIGMIPSLTWHLYSMHPDLGLMYATLTAVILSLILSGGNTIVHGMIDGTIWTLYKVDVKRRLMKKIYKYGGNSSMLDQEIAGFRYYEDKRFYDTIGADQLLHALTIVFFYWMGN